MTLLADGETATVDGDKFAVSQAMVRTKPRRPPPMWFRIARKVAAPAVFGAAVWFPAVRVGLGSCALLFLVAMNVDATRDKLYSKFMPVACKGLDRAIREVKKTVLVPSLRGRVLDFGSGDGQYLRYVAEASGRVSSVVSLEPKRELHMAIRHKAAAAGIKDHNFRVLGGVASELLEQSGEGSFDTIICGNVLCEVPDQAACCSILYRLLMNGGRMFFVEHVREPWGSWARRLQDTLNPLYRLAAGGCNVNRDSLRPIEEQPWQVYAWELQLPSGKPFLGRIHTGLAVKKN